MFAVLNMLEACHRLVERLVYPFHKAQIDFCDVFMEKKYLENTKQSGDNHHAYCDLVRAHI